MTPNLVTLTPAAAQAGLIDAINVACGMMAQNPGAYGIGEKTAGVTNALYLLRRIGFGDGPEAATIRDNTHPAVRQWIEENGINPEPLALSPKIIEEGKGVRLGELDICLWEMEKPQMHEGVELLQRVKSTYTLVETKGLGEEIRANLRGKEGLAFTMDAGSYLRIYFSDAAHSWGQDSVPYAVRAAIGTTDVVSNGRWQDGLAQGNYIVMPRPSFRMDIPRFLNSALIAEGLRLMIYGPKAENIFDLSRRSILDLIGALNAAIKLQDPAPPRPHAVVRRVCAAEMWSREEQKPQDAHGPEFWETALEKSGEIYIYPLAK